MSMLAMQFHQCQMVVPLAHIQVAPEVSEVREKWPREAVEFSSFPLSCEPGNRQEYKKTSAALLQKHQVFGSGMLDH
jgi:hypothetical protein